MVLWLVFGFVFALRLVGLLGVIVVALAFGLRGGCGV